MKVANGMWKEVDDGLVASNLGKVVKKSSETLCR